MKQAIADKENKKLKFNILLEFLHLLSEETYSISGMAAKTGLTERTAYRQVETLKKCGFQIEKMEGKYALTAVPDDFAKMTDRIGITPKEWRLIADALDTVEDALKPGLMRKIAGRTAKASSEQPVIRQQESRNIHELARAIAGKKQVVLQQYRSSHSETVSDRPVEPFAFRNGNRCVDCYEISSHRIKTFKIPRIGSVKVCPEDWQYEKKHRTTESDLFGMSSDTLIPIRLRLSLRAANLLREEFPLSQKWLKADGKDHFLFETDVRDVKGIGRFVLGLHQEVEILDTPELAAFLQLHAKQLASQWLD